MLVLQSLNLGVRFLSELCVLGALGNYGVHAGKGPLLKLLLGAGLPLVAAAIWATYGAPGSDRVLTGPLHLALEAVVFGSGVAALYAAGRPQWAGALGLVIVLNRALMFVWKQ